MRYADLPLRSRLAAFLGLPWRLPEHPAPDPYAEAFAWLTAQLLQLAAEWQAAADLLNEVARGTANEAAARLIADRAGDFAERAGAVRYLAARALTGQFPAAAKLPAGRDFRLFSPGEDRVVASGG